MQNQDQGKTGVLIFFYFAQDLKSHIVSLLSHQEKNQTQEFSRLGVTSWGKHVLPVICLCVAPMNRVKSKRSSVAPGRPSLLFSLPLFNPPETSRASMRTFSLKHVID